MPDQLCIRTLQEFQETEDIYIAARIATFCSVYPWHGLGHERASKLADLVTENVESAIADGRVPSLAFQIVALAKGNCDYRRGEYEAAIEWFEQHIPDEETSSQIKSLRLLFLAMAYHRDGQADASRRLLEHATEMIDEDPVGLGWGYPTFCHVALQEAEKLIGVEIEEDSEELP